MMYSDGVGVARNKATALELFKQARAAGIANATFNLGLVYDEGDDVARNKAKALESCTGRRTRRALQTRRLASA